MPLQYKVSPNNNDPLASYSWYSANISIVSDNEAKVTGVNGAGPRTYFAALRIASTHEIIWINNSRPL